MDSSFSECSGKKRGYRKTKAQRAVYINLGGDEVQPVDPGTVSRIIEEGQGEEGGTHRVYEKVSNDLECDDAR